MQKKRLILGIVAVICIFLSTSLYAGGYGKGNSGKCSGRIEDKFFKKICMVFKNQEVLNITEEQMDKIKDLKYEVKKVLITKEAELDLVELDIKRELYEDEVNNNKINKLVDKKYDSKRDKAKALYSADIAFKSILTEEQTAAMKDLYKKCHKSKKDDTKK